MKNLMNCPICNQELLLFQGRKSDYYCRIFVKNSTESHCLSTDKRLIIRKNNLRLCYEYSNQILYVHNIFNNNFIKLLEIKIDINKAFNICKMNDQLLIDKIKLYQTFS